MSERPGGVSKGIRGRGAAENLPNRFEKIHYHPEPQERGEEDPAPSPSTRLYRDATRTLLARNDSPDVGFDFSINPYRGCEHGCIYCYARPTHEYLGWSAGLDFETRILVKEDAPERLRRHLLSPRWNPQVIALSGNTDPYQPAERKLGLTRRCLQVLAEFRNPVAVVTKSYLVTRDVDLLAELASVQAASVAVSITTLDPLLQRKLEPRASSPDRRLAAVECLASRGVPVRVMVAPVIPALNDHEIPSILEAAAGAGASAASWILLRLPHGVKSLFEEWLERNYPQRKEKVLNRIREMRGGALYNSKFQARMRGEGLFAEQIRSLFESSCRRNGLNRRKIELSAAAFRRPEKRRQMTFFAREEERQEGTTPGVQKQI